MAIPKSGPIKMTDIVATFRNKFNNLGSNSISGYYRNGGNVTDIYDNRNIPQSGPIKFSDFYGSGLKGEYNWPIPELCTDDFIGLAKGIESWNQVSDSKTEYIGRNNTDPNSTTAASMEIPVYNPEGATITIPALSFEIGSERGPDMKYERILKNTSDEAANKGLPTDIFVPGAWAMIIPKKFKRIRIVAVSGGGSGSVQKISLTGLELENKKTKGTVENGYDGGNSTVLHDNFRVSVRGGHGGNKNTDPELSRYDQTMIHSTGLQQSSLAADGQSFVVGGIPTLYDNKSAETPAEHIAIDHHMYSADVPVFDDGSKSFTRNNFPINILYAPPLPHGRRSLGNDHSSNLGFGEDSLFGPGGQPGSEYSSSSTLQTGPVEVLDTSFGAGGAAGQHGGRGLDETGYTATQAGQSGITGYFGDFEVKGGDILNIRVGTAGRKSKNTYNDYDDILDRETQRISESGYGGDGMVQIIGGHGFAHSSLSHPGWVLEDENGDIISSSYATNESSKGVTLYSSSMTSQRTIEVMGPTISAGAGIAPRIYRLRFSARIGKSGDESLKTRICHVGKKSVKVIPLTNSVLKNPPAQVLYDNPDISPDIEWVGGQYHTRDADDNEIIDNWYVPQCNISLAVDSNTSAYDTSATFTKSPQGAVSQERGGGPDSFVLHRSTPVVEFTMAKQEKYVLEKSGLSSTASTNSKYNRIATYLRSRQQFQLDELNEKFSAEDGINSWETADMAVSHSGAGGFFLGLDDPTSENPIMAGQIDYHMISGGMGGRGGSSRPSEDDNKTVYPGDDGSYGEQTALWHNGIEVARTVRRVPAQGAANQWVNTQPWGIDPNLGLGGRHGDNYNTRAHKGFQMGGTLEVKEGDLLEFVIGAGGAGGREHSNNGWEGLDESDSPSYYQWKYGGNGHSGGIKIQGIIYSASGSHIVTNELQFANAVEDNSESLVFRNNINVSVQDPRYNFYWEIGGGRISELFPDLVDADGYVRITEDWQLYSFKGMGPSSQCHHNRAITKFPEFFAETTNTWQSDDSNQSGGTEDHSCEGYRLRSNWKDIAKNSTRLNSPVQEYKTFFSCGYRGDNTIGPGTNIPHNYTPPPVVVVPPSVPKNDHVWDINLCFLAGTMVTMEDGSKKAIEKIDLGESVKIGGRIFACGKFLTNDLHDYHGIKVSGSHMVLENGNWIQVKDSPDSNFISDEVVTTYNFGTENRRLEIEGITFTDYFEIHEKEKLQLVGDEYFNDWQDQDPISKQKTMEIINK